jgi:hypothetical protein
MSASEESADSRTGAACNDVLDELVQQELIFRHPTRAEFGTGPSTLPFAKVSPAFGLGTVQRISPSFAELPLTC